MVYKKPRFANFWYNNVSHKLKQQVSEFEVGILTVLEIKNNSNVLMLKYENFYLVTYKSILERNDKQDLLNEYLTYG